MSDLIELNREFYKKAGFPLPSKPTAMEPTRRNQIFAYLISECVEIGNASELAEQVAELTDLLYFTYDAFLEIGIDPTLPYHIVHEANMAKIDWPDGEARFDGSKVPPRMLRPPNWQPPLPSITTYIEALDAIHTASVAEAI